MKPVRKAVLPVAGLGTRVLPGTKTTPKELLNVVDRPILSYIVEEGRKAGIEHFVFVTGRSKGAIEDYFDHQVELEMQLEAKGKTDILKSCGRAAQARRDELRAPDGPAGPGPRRLVRPRHHRRRAVRGDAARRDRRRQPALAQLIEVYDQVGGGNVIGVEPCPTSETHKYGIVAWTASRRPPEPHDRHGREAAAGTEPSNLFISAATSCSRKSSTCSKTRKRAPATRSS
jgi:UTP--glucose-1-phosphate uridylyltransferase